MVSRLRTDEDRGLIARKALQYLDRQVPFDHAFDLADTSSFYCTELLWRILKDEYGVDFYPEGNAPGAVRGFASFLVPDRFDLVLDHQQ